MVKQDILWDFYNYFYVTVMVSAMLLGYSYVNVYFSFVDMERYYDVIVLSNKYMTQAPLFLDDTYSF